MPYRLQSYLLALLLLPLTGTAAVPELPDVISRITPSVVGVGIVTPLRGNQAELQGSGFVIGNGQYIATNHHVISAPLDTKVVQHRVVFFGRGKQSEAYRVDVVASDPEHDLAILKLQDSSKKLPAELQLASGRFAPPGTSIAFTGFPIGAVLGLYPATHTGIVAAITPDSTRAYSTRQLDPRKIKRLANSFEVYQLDATAFPGNSGSALYNARTGVVIGMINKVFVQSGKEYALATPSGITYAIPVAYLKKLAKDNGINLDE